MSDRFAHARGWLLKADSDLKAAEQLLKARGPYDTACFHAQQAVEKYLKGLLALAEQTIPRTHDLEELQESVTALNLAQPIATMDLARLTPYALELRYDFEFWPNRQTAIEALKSAEQVRRAVLAAVPEKAHP